MKKQAVTLGRIGILIPIAAIIPVLGSLAGLASIILLMISFYNFSKLYDKPVIFNGALTGYIIQIVLGAIGSILFGIALASSSIPGFEAGEMASFDIQSIKEGIFESTLTVIGSIIILLGLIVGFYFIYKSLKALSEKTGVKYFNLAGLLYFIGAIGIIVFFVGAIVIFIAWILHIVAYFTIQPEEEIEQPREEAESS